MSLKKIIMVFLTVLIGGFFLASKSLKEIFKNDFYLGAALNYEQANGKDVKALNLVGLHFNTISPENMLKWGSVHPKPDKYRFAPADNYVNFGQEQDMFIVGHTLVWHQQTPDWVFMGDAGNDASRKVLLERMQKHISTVAGRYRGKINGWDVVNEALEDDGSLRQTKWLKIIGEDYLPQAFAFAQGAAPNAELYYNDYNLWKPGKRDGAIRLVKNLQEEGIQIDGIGMQGHYSLDSPTLDQIEASILAFSKLGVKVMITELDIDVLPKRGSLGADLNESYDEATAYNPYPDGLPDPVQDRLAERYTELFALFHKHQDKISRVTFWGVADHHSWLNNWPIRGRSSYPLLFDRQYKPKPAFDALVDQFSTQSHLSPKK